MEYKLSIALVTRNRPEMLEKVLTSLSKQDVQPYEIVVSDDSNLPEAIEQNRKIAEHFKCVYYSGPKSGLYANRNFVASKITGTHYRTMDDDHVFPPGHLAACYRAIQSEPNTIWTIGEYSIQDPSERKYPFPRPGQLTASGNSDSPQKNEEYFGLSCGGTIYPKILADLKILNFPDYKFGNIYLEYGARLKYLGYDIKVVPDTYFIHYDYSSTAETLHLKAITEARVFAMLCYALIYKRSIKNQMVTFVHVLKALVMGQISLYGVLNAYRNYKKVRLKIFN